MLKSKKPLKKKADKSNVIQESTPAGQEFSPAPSVASMASVSISTDKSQRDFQDLARDIQVQSVFKQTPQSIKRLMVGLIVMLIGISVLIGTLETLWQPVGVEASVALSETQELETRFQLIKSYELRYKFSLVMATMARSYLPNLKKTKATFDSFLKRFISRIDTMAGYNENARKLLFAQNLDFDLEPVTIPEIKQGTRDIIFSHAFLVVHLNASDSP
jgi:hypothetical protein